MADDAPAAAAVPAEIMAIGVQGHPHTMALDQALVDSGIEVEWKVVAPSDTAKLRALAAACPAANGAPTLLLKTAKGVTALKGAGAIAWAAQHEQHPTTDTLVRMNREMAERHRG